MNLLKNITEDLPDVKLALVPWSDVLFCPWVEGGI
jgi:hypothetical protein